MTNAQMAYDDGNFRKVCQNAGVEPTKRQASKFRRGQGKAYKKMKGIHV